MITSKKEYEEWMQYEKGKYSSFGKLREIIALEEYTILLKHQRLLRKTEYYFNTEKKIRGKFFYLRLLLIQNKYSIHIPLNTCGKGLKIMHTGPILINPNAILGEDCSIHTNVSIVADGKTSYAPQIGNGVVIGVGATVLGNISIADNVVIGANSVVNKSIHIENVAIAGVPAKIVSQNGRLTW